MRGIHKMMILKRGQSKPWAWRCNDENRMPKYV